MRFQALLRAAHVGGRYNAARVLLTRSSGSRRAWRRANDALTA